MYKMLIEWDAEKIERDGVYDLKKMQALVNEKTNQRSIVLNNEGFYIGNSFTDFSGIILGLSKADWFLQNVKKWRWFNCDNTTGEVVEEDLLEGFNTIIS